MIHHLCVYGIASHRKKVFVNIGRRAHSVKKWRTLFLTTFAENRAASSRTDTNPAWLDTAYSGDLIAAPRAAQMIETMPALIGGGGR
jgi:hypothetical protein